MAPTTRFAAQFASMAGLFIVLVSISGGPPQESYFWVAATLLLWASIRGPFRRSPWPGWALSGADFAAIWSLLWLSVQAASAATQQEYLQSSSEIAVMAGTEETIFRFAPLVFFAGLPFIWRWLAVTVIGVVLFTVLHLPTWNYLLLDKMVFAAAALMLLQLSRKLLWPTLLHACSNLLWQTMDTGAGVDAAAYIVADIGLAVGSVAIAYLLIRVPFKYSKDPLIS